MQTRILEDLTSKFDPSDNREDTAILYEITGFQRNTNPNTAINEPDENLIFDSMPEKQAESPPKPSQDLKTEKKAHWSYDYDQHSKFYIILNFSFRIRQKVRQESQ